MRRRIKKRRGLIRQTFVSFVRKFGLIKINPIFRNADAKKRPPAKIKIRTVRDFDKVKRIAKEAKAILAPIPQVPTKFLNEN